MLLRANTQHRTIKESIINKSTRIDMTLAGQQGLKLED